MSSGLYTPHTSAVQTNAVCTPRLWDKIKFHQNSGNPAGGGATDIFVPHFKTFGGLVTSNVGHYSDQFAGHYYSYQSTNSTLLTLATDRSGVLRSLLPATDNSENVLQPGSASAVSGVISETDGASKLLIFETRVRPSAVADGVGSFFVGLSEEGTAITDGVITDDNGGLADKDLIGFYVDQADGDAVKFVFKKAGQTAVTVMTYGTALAANAWINLGFTYDPSAAATKRIAIWIDGVEQSTYVASGSTAGKLGYATFPLDEELQPVFAHKTTAATAHNLDYAGWRFYQEN